MDITVHIPDLTHIFATIGGVTVGVLIYKGMQYGFGWLIDKIGWSK